MALRFPVNRRHATDGLTDGDGRADGRTVATLNAASYTEDHITGCNKTACVVCTGQVHLQLILENGVVRTYTTPISFIVPRNEWVLLVLACDSHKVCILIIFMYDSVCWAFTKRDVLKIDALDRLCLHKLLQIKWYHHVRNDDDVRRTTKQPKQPHLSAIVYFSQFGHIARMPDETDAEKILTASTLKYWWPPGRPCTTWMKTIKQDLKSSNLSWTKQLTWLRIIHSGDWCLRFALHTPSGACRKRMNEWLV